MIRVFRELRRSVREYDALFGRGATAREALTVFSATASFYVLSILAAYALGAAL